MRKLLPEGETRVISGRVEQFGGHIQMPHPDHIAPLSDIAGVKTVGVPGVPGLFTVYGDKR